VRGYYFDVAFVYMTGDNYRRGDIVLLILIIRIGELRIRMLLIRQF